MVRHPIRARGWPICNAKLEFDSNLYICVFVAGAGRVQLKLMLGSEMRIKGISGEGYAYS